MRTPVRCLFLFALSGCSLGLTPHTSPATGSGDAAPHVDDDAEEPADWGTAEPPPTDAGRLVLRRLNSTVLERTVHALLETETPIAALLPADGVAHGFDNNAAAQSLSVLHLESLERAFDQALSDSLPTPATSTATTLAHDHAGWDTTASEAWCSEWSSKDYGINLWNDDTMGITHPVAYAGDYTLTVRAASNWRDGTTLRLQVDGEEVGAQEITAPCNAAGDPYEEMVVSATLDAGLVDFTLLLDNPAGETVALVVDSLRIEGPLGADGAWPPGQEKLYRCDPEAPGEEEACLTDIVRGLLEEAWRRPVQGAEVDAVLDVAWDELDGSGDVHSALRAAAMRALLSPHFLFLVEVPESPDAASQPLSAHALAARLSLFLWGRHPDAELRAAADDGTGSPTTPSIRRSSTRSRASTRGRPRSSPASSTASTPPWTRWTRPLARSSTPPCCCLAAAWRRGTTTTTPPPRCCSGAPRPSLMAAGWSSKMAPWPMFTWRCVPPCAKTSGPTA